MRNKVTKRMLGDPRSSTFQRATRSLILEELDLKTMEVGGNTRFGGRRVYTFSRVDF